MQDVYFPGRDICLDRRGARHRSFFLGNKQAFSLSLPATPGPSDATMHRHKWFGAYLYGRKYLEGHLLRSGARIMGPGTFTSFTMTPTSAQRAYEVDGLTLYEDFFIPDGVQGIACTFTGDLPVTVDPEFDLRFARAMNASPSIHRVEMQDRGAVISAPLPSGHFDDASECFVEDGAGTAAWLYAAVEVIGPDTRVERISGRQQFRRKLYRADHTRRHHVRLASLDADHAPLWTSSDNRVYAPVRLHLPVGGMVLYGFGSTREEALQQIAVQRDRLDVLRDEKRRTAESITRRSMLRTGSDPVDTAYAHVVARFMDALVARDAEVPDTALDHRATMILAGNQYFHDSWKRDENIAVGALLTLGFYDLARDVIRDSWQLQDPITGRLPQRIRSGEEPPYHSSDGTLWALLRLDEYRRVSGDTSLLEEKLPMVRYFLNQALERSRDGLLPSGRSTDPEYLWETWMDTPHTPRHGFPIEIQLLWIACLRRYRPIIAPLDSALESSMERAEAAAWQALQRFAVRGVLADSLDEAGEVRDLITPNPYFAFGIGLDLGAEMERALRRVGRRELAGKQGIITLAPGDWERVFPQEFLQNRHNVRGRRMRSAGKFNYHRGVEWNWLARFFVEAELKYGHPNTAWRTYLRGQVESVLARGGIGGISELFDLSGNRGPEFQAWSMAGFLEALHAFAGVVIDVPGQRITVAPQIPSAWPELHVRRWYGHLPMDLHYVRGADGHTLEVVFPEGTPDAEIEIALVTLRGESVVGVTARLDGVTHAVPFTRTRIPGTGRTRSTVTAPAASTMTIEMVTQPRMTATA